MNFHACMMCLFIYLSVSMLIYVYVLYIYIYIYIYSGKMPNQISSFTGMCIIQVQMFDLI